MDHAQYNARLTAVTRGKLAGQVRAPFSYAMEIGKTGQEVARPAEGSWDQFWPRAKIPASKSIDSKCRDNADNDIRDARLPPVFCFIRATTFQTNVFEWCTHVYTTLLLSREVYYVRTYSTIVDLFALE